MILHSSPHQIVVKVRLTLLKQKYTIAPKSFQAGFQATLSKSRVCIRGCSNLILWHRAMFSSLKSLLFYFSEFPSWPLDFRFQFISFTPKRQKCILIYERYQYSAWARARFCWPSNKRDVGVRWSDWGSIPGMRCTRITQQSGGSQSNGWHDNYLCVPKDTPYV